MIYQFENYSLDTERRELRRGADLVTVEPQVFDVLEYLVRNRERIISKDDLIAGVWEGRIVSDSTLSSRITAVRHALDDSGEQQRLIRTVSRKGVRFIGAVRETPERPIEKVMRSGAEGPGSTRSTTGGEAPPLPDKPSIAVLPFANLSGDPEQEYFTDGITEDVITALSQFRWFFVIAHGSSSTYKGRAVDVKQVGRELGVRYVLEGSVRKAANRVRISGQLIDASTGVHLWADRFDGALEDIFDLQDKVSTSVVGAIAPRMEQAEIERATRKPTESLDAYDYFLRGMANVHRWTREANSEALRLFYKAIELDSNFAAAHGMAARCYSQSKFSGWTINLAQESAETERLARRAAELGRDVPVALCTAGLGLAYVVGDTEYGAALIDRSLELNPNLAWAWLFSGWVNIITGQPEVAIERVARAIRLSPQDPHIFNMRGVTAAAYFFAGRYGEASSFAESAFRDHTRYLMGYLIYAASKALCGQLEDARTAVTRARQLDQALHISNLDDRYRFRRPEDVAKLADGLRKAGLPE